MKIVALSDTSWLVSFNEITERRRTFEQVQELTSRIKQRARG